MLVMQEELGPIRAKRKELEQHIPEIYEILKKGSEEARKAAAETMAEVKRAMRINYFEDAALIQEQSERLQLNMRNKYQKSGRFIFLLTQENVTVKEVTRFLALTTVILPRWLFLLWSERWQDQVHNRCPCELAICRCGKSVQTDVAGLLPGWPFRYC